jgi:hypothetical protein
VGCPHGHGAPEGCSSCLGAPARRVAIVGRHIAIDGELVASVQQQQAVEHEDHIDVPHHRRGTENSRRVTRSRRCTRCGAEGHTRRRCAA